MNEVVLIGDSIFDNAAYVGNGPDVSQQVDESLPEGWKATLRLVLPTLAGIVVPKVTSRLLVRSGRF